MNEILATIEVGQSEIVTRVVERVDGGDGVLLGQGRVVVKEAMRNGVVMNESLTKQAIIQSLTEAERNARVSIREVSLRHDGTIDIARIRQILRSIPVRERRQI